MLASYAGGPESLSQWRAAQGTVRGATAQPQQPRQPGSPPRRRSLEAARAAADAGMSVSTGFGGSVSAVRLQRLHRTLRKRSTGYFARVTWLLLFCAIHQWASFLSVVITFARAIPWPRSSPNARSPIVKLQLHGNGKLCASRSGDVRDTS